MPDLQTQMQMIDGRIRPTDRLIEDRKAHKETAKLARCLGLLDY